MKSPLHFTQCANGRTADALPCERGAQRLPVRGFTLIELMVTIAVIGILSALVLGALSKASTSAKILKTQSTVAKLHQQIMTKWESYRFRRLPVDARLLLQGSSTQSNNVLAFVNLLWTNRGSVASDPLSVTVNDPLGREFPSGAQLAATRLLMMRELQRYEMPTGFGDIIDTDKNGVFQGSAGAWTMRSPSVLLLPPQLAQAYLQRINAARDINGKPPSQAQLQMYDAAECLYLIVKLACEDENTAMVDSITEVGDADGDGLLEFQDAFAGMMQSYQTNSARNNPIMWIRWPSGFTNVNIGNSSGPLLDSFHVSDFQDDPVNMLAEGTGGNGKGGQVINDPMTFSLDNHDYFDTLKLDIPGASGLPRGYQLTPLIYSAGPDDSYGNVVPSVWGNSTYTLPQQPWADTTYTLPQQAQYINDPYVGDANGLRAGQWYDFSAKKPYSGTMDNITNHLLNAR